MRCERMIELEWIGLFSGGVRPETHNLFQRRKYLRPSFEDAGGDWRGYAGLSPERVYYRQNNPFWPSICLVSCFNNRFKARLVFKQYSGYVGQTGRVKTQFGLGEQERKQDGILLQSASFPVGEQRPAELGNDEGPDRTRAIGFCYCFEARQPRSG